MQKQQRQHYNPGPDPDPVTELQSRRKSATERGRRVEREKGRERERCVHDFHFSMETANKSATKTSSSSQIFIKLTYFRLFLAFYFHGEC